MCVCVCVCVFVVVGTAMFWVWKDHLRVKVTICILEGPGLNPDLDIYSRADDFRWFSQFIQANADLVPQFGRWPLFSLCNLFFTLSYHQSMLSYGLCCYLHQKRKDNTYSSHYSHLQNATVAVSRNFLRKVSSWRTSVGAACEAIHLYYTECYSNASVEVAL